MAGSLTDGSPDPSTPLRVTPSVSRDEGGPYGSGEGAPYASRRTVEIWTAVAAGLVGVVAVSESLTHDIGWNETGPGSGYFPFRIHAMRIRRPSFAGTSLNV